jgi:hypothetical protein
MIARVLLSKIRSPLKFQVPPDSPIGNRRAGARHLANTANFPANGETRAVSPAVKFFLLAGFYCAQA